MNTSSNQWYSRHVEEESTPLAFFETLDGYVAVRWMKDSDSVLLQYNVLAAPSDPYKWLRLTDTTLRTSLAKVLDLELAPKLVALDQVVYNEPPLTAYSLPNVNQSVLENNWSDFARDRITLTANLAYDNSEYDAQLAFNEILNRQRLFKVQAQVDAIRRTYI